MHFWITSQICKCATVCWDNKIVKVSERHDVSGTLLRDYSGGVSLCYSYKLCCCHIQQTHLLEKKRPNINFNPLQLITVWYNLFHHSWCWIHWEKGYILQFFIIAIWLLTSAGREDVCTHIKEHRYTLPSIEMWTNEIIPCPTLERYSTISCLEAIHRIFGIAFQLFGNDAQCVFMLTL